MGELFLEKILRVLGIGDPHGLHDPLYEDLDRLLPGELTSVDLFREASSERILSCFVERREILRCFRAFGCRWFEVLGERFSCGRSA